MRGVENGRSVRSCFYLTEVRDDGGPDKGSSGYSGEHQSLGI